jgi:hypothetical protein
MQQLMTNKLTIKYKQQIKTIKCSIHHKMNKVEKHMLVTGHGNL